MKQRNYVQVSRVSNRHLYRSTRFGRTTSVLNNPSIYKNVQVTRCHSIQNFYPTEKIDQVPRRVISLPNNINQNIENLNNTIQSISITPIEFQMKKYEVQLRNNSQTEKFQNTFKELEQSNKKRQNKKPGFCQRFCPCTPMCQFISLLSLLIFGAIITGIIVGLLPWKETIITTTSSSSTSTTTNLCTTVCTSEQTCIDTICINVGRLACTLTWSRPGDGDIVITTPDNNTIYYRNRGPSLNTSDGQLDRDDLNGTGPENVYWSSNSTLPPIGTYYLCFEPYDIQPIINITNPITVIYRVTRPVNNILTLTRTFFNVSKNAYSCSSTAPTLVGIFTYP